LSPASWVPRPAAHLASKAPALTEELRRSELVALDRADVEQIAEGLVVMLRRSNTDPEGAGRLLGVPRGHHPKTGPVTAYAAGLDGAAIDAGPSSAPSRPDTARPSCQPRA
jgi:hypothetical protein